MEIEIMSTPSSITIPTAINVESFFIDKRCCTHLVHGNMGKRGL